PDLMMRISKEGIYLDVMPAKEIKTAIPKNKMVGKHLSEVLPPEIARQRMEYIEKALARGQTQIYEFELLINNEIRYQEARIAVIDENEVLIIVRDTTEAKLSEIALHKSEARFRAAIEGSFDAFYILESVRDRLGEIVDFKFVELNSRGSALVSLPKEAVIGSSLCELLPVNRTDGFFDKYKQVVETGVALEEEFSLAAPGLTASWIRHQIVPLGDGIAITSRDITDRKLVEEAWCKSEEQLQGILDNAPLCIYVKDTEGKYILASRRQETLFHIRREEIPGKTDYDIFPREMAEIFRANDLEVLATGTAVESEEVAPHDDGLHTYISIKFPLYDSAGIA
ncbi:MAG TPA: PAS domain-containing protein, partial [Phormidium sp.]